MNILIFGNPSPWKEQFTAALTSRGHTLTFSEAGALPEDSESSPRFELVLFCTAPPWEEAVSECRRLRARFPSPQTQLVACHGESAAAEASRLLAAGADDVWRLAAGAEEMETRLAVTERRAAQWSCNRRSPRGGEAGVPLWPSADEVPYGMIRLMCDGRLAEVNQGLVEMLGYSSREELLQINSIADLYFDPEERVRLLATLPPQIKGIEVLLKRRDGTPLPVQLSGHWVYDAAGNWVALEGVILDWSPQRQALDLLRLQRDLAITLSTCGNFEAIFEALLSAVVQLEGVDGAAIYLYDCATGSLTLRAAKGGSQRFLSAVATFPPESEKTQRVIQGGSIYCQPQDLSPPIAEACFAEGVKFVGVVPVLNEGHIVASLNFVSFSQDHFTLATQHTVETVTQRIGGIVARMQAEEAIKSNQKNLQNLFETLADLVFVTDMECQILHVNPAVEKCLGYTRTELVGRDILELHPEDQRAQSLDQKEKIFRGQSALCMIPFVAKDGTLVPAETRVAFGQWDGKPAAIGLTRDLSEMQNTLHALEESEKRFRTIFDNAATGLALSMLDGRILKVNAVFAQMLDCPPEQIVGHSYLDFTHPDDVAGEIILMRCLIDERLRSTQVEKRYRRADGATFWGRMTASLVQDADGTPQYVIAIVEDIDDRKRAEDAQQKSEARLQHLIEIMPDYLVLTGVDGTIRYLNRSTPHATPESAVGTTMFSYVADTHRAGVQQVVQDCVARKEIQEVEFLDILGLWWRAHFIPLLEENHVHELMVITSEITVRKRAVDQLRASEARLQHLIETMPDYLVLIGVDGTIHYLNRDIPHGALQTVKETIVFNYIADTHREQSFEAFQACVTRKEIQDIEVMDILGHWWRARLVPMVEEDQVRELMVIASEITVQKQAADQLRESEARYRSLVENLPDFVLVVNQQGTILYANRDSPATHRDEHLGANLHSFLREDSEPTGRAAFDRAFAENQVQTVEVTDRSEHIWSSRIIPLPADGEPQLAMVVSIDITEQKKTQEALLNEQRLLRHLLDLQERDRQLTAYELHDGFAQQLTAALLHLENYLSLQECNPVQAQQQLHGGLDMIRRGLVETRRLISGLRPLILDEAGIIEAVNYLIAEQRERTGLDIFFKHDVHFDRLAPPLETAVFRIVQESLANTCQHSKSDFIRVELYQAAECLHIKVRDEGVGFDPEAVSPDRFGLRGIRERARLLDGQAEIRSRPGEGTEIHAVLPLVYPAGEET